MTEKQFIELLKKHDWYFRRADDSRSYGKGLITKKEILRLTQKDPNLRLAYVTYVINRFGKDSEFDIK